MIDNGLCGIQLLWQMHKGMYNGVMSAFLYACYVGFLLNWRRQKEEKENCLPLSKG
jgi:hypothetical protein